MARMGKGSRMSLPCAREAVAASGKFALCDPHTHAEAEISIPHEVPHVRRRVHLPCESFPNSHLTRESQAPRLRMTRA